MSQQRWKLRRRAFAIRAVTEGALALVEREARAAGLVLGEAAGPGDVVGVDVDDCLLRVDGGPAPLRAAIEAGKDDCFFADAERE